MSILRTILICLSLGQFASAADWPQILGPNRDGVGSGELFKDWPTSGPKQQWSIETGEGLAGVAIAGGQVFLFHRPDKNDELLCLDAKNGQKLWSKSFESDYRSTISEDNGPRCVPVVTSDRIVLLSAEGVLRVVSRKDGSSLWQIDLAEQYNAPEGYFGFGSTPLVWNGTVLVNAGGKRSGAGVVSFDLKSGKERWKAIADDASYSAPRLLTTKAADSTEQTLAIVVTRLNVVGLSPDSGEEAFRFRFGSRGPTVNGASPVFMPNGDLFLTASYGVGSLFLKITEDGFEEEYRSQQPLSTQYCTPIEHEGLLYCVDGRDDGPNGRLVCCDPKTRKELWSTPTEYGTVLRIGDRGLMLTTDGELMKFPLTPKGFSLDARARIAPEGSTTRALPAFANGRLFVKTDSRLLCLQLGVSSEDE